jgi:hypothetical protein
MFIEYDHAFIWECEACTHKAVFPPHNFYDCVAELKQRGWQFSHDEEGWHHSCPRHRRSLKEWMNEEVPKSTVKVVK